MIPLVCLVKVRAPLDDRTVSFLMSFSPLEKQQRILRQRVKQNADTMVVGSALIRYMLWKKFSISPNAQISYGKYGKPYLSEYPHIHFNISHSGPYVACAICDVPIGVDIQEIIFYHPDVANKVFSPIEVKQIEKSLDPSIEFTKLWTRMEAQIKAAGFGIGDKVDYNALDYETKTNFIENTFISISWRKQVHNCNYNHD